MPASSWFSRRSPGPAPCRWGPGLVLLAGCGQGPPTLRPHSTAPGPATADTAAPTDTAAPPDTAAPTPGDRDTGAADTGAPAPSLDWGPCPAPDALGDGARCAAATVPLVRPETARALGLSADPAFDPDATLELRLIDLPARGPHAGTLWLLDGGPGGTGLGPARSAALTSKLRENGFDVRIPVHRGAAGPDRLQCRGVDERACLADLQARHGPGLAGHAMREAVEDVVFWLDQDLRRGPDILWGLSYGSNLAQRVLDHHPAAVDGVILDGALPLDADIAWVNVEADAPLRDFLAGCLDHPVCTDRTGGDPAGLLARGIDALRTGRCPLAIGVPAMELLLRGMVSSDHAPLVLPVAAMLDRCDAADQAALDHFLRYAARYVPADELNEDLGLHLSLLDLWAPEAPLSEVEAAEAGLLLPGRSVDNLYAAGPAWAALPQLDHPRRPARWEAPVLLLQGGRDLNTVPAWSARLAAQLDTPRTTRALFPTGGHGLLQSAADPALRACAAEVVGAFAADPGAPVDLGCIAGLPPVDHDLRGAETRERARTALGTAHPWRP